MSETTSQPPKDEPAAEESPQSSEPTVVADPAKTHLAGEWKHTSPLISCRFDPAGRFVFAGAQDNTVQRWELATGKQTPYVGHNSWVRSIGFDPTGEWLYTGGYEGQLIRWSATADEPVPERSVKAHEGWVRALSVSPDGQLLATCGNDHLVKLWASADGSLIREMAGHECHVYNVLFHPDGQSLVSADLKGVVKHWNVADGAEVRELDAKKLYKYDGGFRADIGGSRSIAFSLDGTNLACGGITEVSNAFAGVGKPAAVLIDWAEGKEVQFHHGKEQTNGTLWGLNFHPDDYLIGSAGGGSGGFVYFWKTDKDIEFHRFKLPNTTRDHDLSPDGITIAEAHYDGVLRLYKMTEKPPEPAEKKEETAG